MIVKNGNEEMNDCEYIDKLLHENHLEEVEKEIINE